MAEPEIVGALAECLEALRQGEDQVDACLQRHSAHRAELEALLAVVWLIPSLPPEMASAGRIRDGVRRALRRHGGGDRLNGWGWQSPRFP
jgi:hypothetical protein